jgi:pimeloyl-ACP methyl ester carboxylesterase
MPERTQQTILFPRDEGHPVRGDLYLPDELPANRIVVLCHGFKGYKSWGFFPYLGERLRQAGLIALSMDFSFNGTYPEIEEPTLAETGDGPAGVSAAVDVSGDAALAAGARSAGGSSVGGGPSDGPVRYPRPDLFRRNTMKRERDDLACVIEQIHSGRIEHLTGTMPTLGLFGHSRGGLIAILNAVGDGPVEALCTWSTVDDPDFYTSRRKEKWRSDGIYEFIDARDGARLLVDATYLDDLEENHDEYLLVERVKELRVPHLIVHGTVDMAIHADCARNLHEAESELADKKLVLLRTGHTFGIPYPGPEEMGEPTRELKQAANETVGWFTTYLTRGAKK